MPRGVKRTPTPTTKRKGPPASSPEARENQLIAMAYDLAEQRLLDGTASAQEVTHFLKLGSSKERQEREMMEMQKKLLEAKTESLASMKHRDELYAEALKAMRTYTGMNSESNETEDIQ